jgi:riboflavin kinase, archaea type
LATLSFDGKVYSGKGEGKKFVSLPWVEKQIREKVGFIPYGGTLNIQLSKDSVALKKKLEKARRIEIVPEKGYCKATMIRAKVFGLECVIIIPQVPAYPPDVMEVISPFFLRQCLHLSDGSEAVVTLNF